jgi:thioredoxin reductase (NADPH)
MSLRVFDVVVIGAGPAGLAAARAAAEAGVSVVAIDRMGPGGELMNLEALLGTEALMPDATGPDLIAKLAEEAMAAGVELAIDEVQAVTFEDGWRVEALEDTFSAGAVIVASGLSPGTTGLAAEADYEGRGLSHCAHCDAPLYAGRPVVVAGDDRWAVEEAIHLVGHADSVVLVSAVAPEASAERLAVIRGLGNVRQVQGRIIALTGADGLAQVTVETGDGARHAIPASGLFLQSGRRPARGFLDPAHERSPGLDWAGDVRPGARRAIAEAIADGARAGQNAASRVLSRRSS